MAKEKLRKRYTSHPEQHKPSHLYCLQPNLVGTYCAAFYQNNRLPDRLYRVIHYHGHKGWCKSVQEQPPQSGASRELSPAGTLNFM